MGKHTRVYQHMCMQVGRRCQVPGLALAGPSIGHGLNVYSSMGDKHAKH